MIKKMNKMNILEFYLKGEYGYYRCFIQCDGQVLPYIKGCNGNFFIIFFSNGRIIKTNDLWIDTNLWVNIPENIYICKVELYKNQNFTEEYIY